MPVIPPAMPPALVRLFRLAVVAAVAPEALRAAAGIGFPGLAPTLALLEIPGGSGKGRDTDIVL